METILADTALERFKQNITKPAITLPDNAFGQECQKLLSRYRNALDAKIGDLDKLEAGQLDQYLEEIQKTILLDLFKPWLNRDEDLDHTLYYCKHIAQNSEYSTFLQEKKALLFDQKSGQCELIREKYLAEHDRLVEDFLDSAGPMRASQTEAVDLFFKTILIGGQSGYFKSCYRQECIEVPDTQIRSGVSTEMLTEPVIALSPSSIRHVTNEMQAILQEKWPDPRIGEIIQRYVNTIVKGLRQESMLMKSDYQKLTKTLLGEVQKQMGDLSPSLQEPMRHALVTTTNRLDQIVNNAFASMRMKTGWEPPKKNFLN